MSSPEAPAPILVVGAGPAGLATAWALQERGLRYRIVDGASRVAEPWRRRHDDLVLNTHRWTSALPGLRLPRSGGPYPTRDQYVDYLERYAMRLDAAVRWETEVQRVDRGPGGLVLTTTRGELAAAHVVLATGPERVPAMPVWPGAAAFRGRLAHAAAFRRDADHEGEDVLVVGLGISGVDLCTTLLRRRAGRLWISVRGGATLVPRRILGVPLQPVGLLFQPLPVAMQDRVIRGLSRMALGASDRGGLPRAARGPVSRFLVEGTGVPIDDGFLRAVDEGRIGVVPEIARFDGDDVRLRDGGWLRPATVLAATGYRPALEPLVGHLGVLDDRGLPIRVACELPECPGLWFAGQRSAFYGNLHARGDEARRIARGIQLACA